MLYKRSRPNILRLGQKSTQVILEQAVFSSVGGNLEKGKKKTQMIGGSCVFRGFKIGAASAKRLGTTGIDS